MLSSTTFPVIITKSRPYAIKSRNSGKSFLQTLFFFLLVTQICFAQWYQQNSGTTQNLNAVTFTNVNIGFAVGDSGTILRTTNGGTDWTPILYGTTNDFNDICFTDANSGWAVGDSGTILHTTNGGINWVKQTSGTTGGLNGVCFIDANNGWIVGEGGTIIRTTNGGIDWTPQTSGTWMRLNDVCFTDANIGVAVGGENGWVTAQGIILRTTNGGATWTEQATGTTHTYFEGIVFIGANIGITVGDEKHYLFTCEPNILRTIDGGITWDSVLVMDGIALHNVVFTDENNGTVIGSGGIILRTTNGGIDLIIQTSGTTNSLSGVYFTDALTGWIVGDNGTILHTTNGGNPVPVEFTTFSAIANNKEVILNWSTATELNNQGFEVQRKFGSNDFVTVGSVKGHGTTTSPNQYSYVDKLTDAGKYFYRLKQTDFGGKYEYSQTVEINWSPFTTYKLEQNYPNPFNPTTTIGFGIMEKGNVRLSVLNILGEEIKVLLNEEKEAGYHSVDFTGIDLPSGVYFYRIHSGNFIDTKKMILLK